MPEDNDIPENIGEPDEDSANADQDEFDAFMAKKTPEERKAMMRAIMNAPEAKEDNRGNA